MSPLCAVHSYAWCNGQAICLTVLPTFLFPVLLFIFVPFNTPTLFIFVVIIFLDVTSRSRFMPGLCS